MTQRLSVRQPFDNLNDSLTQQFVHYKTITGPAIWTAFLGRLVGPPQAVSSHLSLPQAATMQSLITGRGATKWINVGRLL